MLRLLSILYLTCVFLNADGQIITTFAGNGSDSIIIDGMIGTSAGIGQPYGCAVDSHGDLYFTAPGGSNGNWIRKVTTCGIISTVAGNGGEGYNGDGIAADTAELYDPLGIAFDSFDNLYIAEEGNNRIRKINSVTGIITTIAGTGIEGFSGDGGHADSAMLNQPSNICVDKYGNLYIVEPGNQRIRKVNTLGIIKTFAGTGTAGYTGDGGPADSAEIENLYGICTDTLGNIYFEQSVDDVIRKIDTSGIITTIAGDGSYIASGDGGEAIYAGFNPYGLAFDRFGNLFISGYYGNDIRKINDSGIITTIAGNGVSGFSGDGGPADSAELYVPYGVAVDAYGNLYIADDGNSRIRKVTFNPSDTLAPTVTITSSVGDTICSGTAVTLTATVTGDTAAASYQWLVSGTPVADTSDAYTYFPASGDSVKCVVAVSDVCNPVSSNTLHLLVASPSVFTIAVSADTVCANSTVTFTTSAPGATYSWYVNGTPSGAMDSTYTYSPLNGDSVYCVATGIPTCGDTSGTVNSNTIYMVVAANVIPTITLSAPAVAPIGSTVTVTAAITGAGTTYSIKWYNNGVLFDSTDIPTVTYTKTADTDLITATITPFSNTDCYEAVTSAPYMITSAKLGIINVAAFPTNIYPNPAYNEITITGNNITNVTIGNLLSQTLITQNTQSNKITINISALPAGIYFLSVIDREGGKIVTKIAKE